MKQCLQRTKFGDLDDIAKCVSQSSTVNVPQLVGTLDCSVFAPSYTWSEFFDDIMIKSALKSISRLHHFQFELPPVVTPSGFSAERKQYLNEKIREFSPDDKKDIICPMP